MSLIQCPKCKRNVLYDALSCTYCGCKLEPKSINGNHLIPCPNCKRIITNTAEICTYCGCKLSPARKSTINEKEKEEKEARKSKITSVIVISIIVIILFKVCSPFGGSESTKSPANSTYKEKNTSPSATYSDRYVVNTDVIFAATSEANFNLLMNCIESKDQQAAGTMVLSGQVKYLYKNTVVYLVTAKWKYFIVRKEGSTELLYIVGEQVTQK